MAMIVWWLYLPMKLMPTNIQECKLNSPEWQCGLHAALCDKVGQLPVAGRWFKKKKSLNIDGQQFHQYQR